MTGEAPSRRFLLVRCGERSIALPAKAVVRVLGGTTVTPVPGSAAEVLGVAQVEGEPVLVLDLARLTGEIPAASASIPAGVQVRLGRTPGDETLLFVVDEAVGFVEIAEDSITRTNEGVLAGTASIGNRTVGILDPGRFAGEEG